MVVLTTAGDTALTRMLNSASSIARCWVSAWSPAFAMEYAEEGVALIACFAHIEPMLTIDPPSCCFMFLATA